MRLKAEIWVKAYIRSCSVAGAMAVVVRHGDDDAGAIFIKISRLDGTASLYGPAFAGFEGAESDRRWARLVADAPEFDVDERLARENSSTSTSGSSRSRIARGGIFSATGLPWKPPPNEKPRSGPRGLIHVSDLGCNYDLQTSIHE